MKIAVVNAKGEWESATAEETSAENDVHQFQAAHPGGASGSGRAQRQTANTQNYHTMTILLAGHHLTAMGKLR